MTSVGDRAAGRLLTTVPPMRRLLLLSTVAMLVAAGVFPPQAGPAGAGEGFAYTVQRGIVYGVGEVDGGGSFADLKLDLYTPQGTGQTRFPLVVVIHGGGFYSGSRGQGNVVQWSRAAAARGYLVASIDYRLVRDDPVPSADFDPMLAAVAGAPDAAQANAAVAAFDDTRTALEFLLARPEVDDDRVALWGGSAGAVTALYVAYALDDFGIAAPPVQAVVDNWGGFAATPGQADQLDSGEAPLFINHGTADPTVPFALTEDIVDRARALGLHYVLNAEAGAGHGFDLADTPFVPGVTVLDAVLDWLDQVVAEGDGCADPFYDTPAWIEAAAEWAYCGPYLSGYPDHTFRPMAPITRGEAARLLHRVAGSPDVSTLADHGFVDVPAWVDDAVTWLVAEGYATGFADDTFRPNAPITRAEFTRMQFRIAGSPDGPPHGFSDVPDWVTPAVDWIADPVRVPPYAGGYPDGTYRPDAPITRGETTRMTCRIAGTAAC